MKGVIGSLLFCVACSAEHSAQHSQRPAVPFAVETRAAPPASTQSTRTLALEDFTPVLSLPAFKKVADALEAEDARRAVKEAELVMEASPPPPADVPRYQFLLGRLREGAGDLSGAAASYKLATATAWPLRDYARVSVARVLLRAGHGELSLQALTPPPTESPVNSDARLITAEAATLVGQHTLAIESWQAHLEHRPEPSDWAVVSLRLAGALLERYESIFRRDPLAARAEAPSIALQVLKLSRAVAVRAASDGAASKKAGELEARALELLPLADRARLARPTVEEHLTRLTVLVEGRRWAEAEQEASSLFLALPREARFGAVGCEATVLKAKALAGGRAWGKAAEVLGDAIGRCQDGDVAARALFLAGKYSDADKRYAQAIRHYDDLEKRFPEHRLADDARLRAAASHRELGAEARFTELLTRMADDYPKGDMVLDGLFELAARRMEKGDFQSASTVLERAAGIARARDRFRGHEFAGRERYFLARSKGEIGEKGAALDEYEAIIGELPMSYYMLHAYARLHEADSARAELSRQRAVDASTEHPFSFGPRPEFEQPGFVRALELFRQGDVDLARRELELLGLPHADAAPELLWAVALLYARSGSAKLSHGVARGLLTDWLGRWPSGDWTKAWELAFPRPYFPTVSREAKKNGVFEHLVYAVMREESAFEPEAVSSANAYGLMQIIEPTARHYARPVGLPADPASLKKPAVNIALGCRVLGHLIRSFPENSLLAIPGYNAGPGRPRKWVQDRPETPFDLWVELIPFNETRRYTKRVLASRAAYAFLYEPDHAHAAMLLPAKVTK